ncbi:ABC transporter permease [Microbacterium elymi]|uniref:ABC transporter permease n=1 Tax=Microbacterium elymi TaxID=2909587 RepID=A0ABY5NLJ0_9MICO|nr:ABC transporter permease [Microbacterium elymi]UUT35979.1 ABC transporter permease [Microbacterium elymi]
MSVAQIAGGTVPDVARRAAKKDWMFLVGLAMFVIIALGAVIGPWVAPFDANQLYTGPVNGASSLAHPFGTDDVGRDILSRVLVGARVTVFAPIAVVILSTLMGVMLALVAAWYGGWVQGGISRLIDVIFAIPGLVVAVLAIALFGKGLFAPIIALSIAYIPVVARLSQTAAARELGKPYVAALRVQGVSNAAICFRHLLPAMVPIVAAQMAVGFGYAMLDLAAISFLGLGQQPPNPDWGSMISSGQAGILAGAPEQSVFPAIFVVITVLAVGIIGARVTVWAEEKDK